MGLVQGVHWLIPILKMENVAIFREMFQWLIKSAHSGSADKIVSISLNPAAGDFCEQWHRHPWSLPTWVFSVTTSFRSPKQSNSWFITNNWLVTLFWACRPRVGNSFSQMGTWTQFCTILILSLYKLLLIGVNVTSRLWQCPAGLIKEKSPLVWKGALVSDSISEVKMRRRVEMWCDHLWEYLYLDL